MFWSKLLSNKIPVFIKSTLLFKLFFFDITVEKPLSAALTAKYSLESSSRFLTSPRATVYNLFLG